MAQVSGTVLDEYRAYMDGRGYAMTTIRSRLRVAREFTAEHDWDGEVTFRDVERWLRTRPVKRPTQRTFLVALRAWYWWALREGLADKDPTALVEGPRLDRRLPRPAREVEIGTVLAGAKPQMAAMIAVMACAGLRCCEVSRLRWEDVDFEDGSIFVFGKGSKERRIWPDPEVMALLAGLDGTGGPVFPGRFGGQRSPELVSRLVSRAFRRSGSTATAHQLRHRCATRSLEATGNLEAVRTLLGHQSVATTQIYAALVPAQAKEAGRAVRLPHVPRFGGVCTSDDEAA